MRLTARLWLFGALLPVVALWAATLVGSARFRRELERGVDDALLAQVAVESVSLFDDREPHLHVAQPPLDETVRRVVPSAAIYAPDGRVLLRHPDSPAALTDARLDLEEARAEPTLSTRRGPAGERVRAVTMAVAAPDGRRHGLQLAASLANVDAAVATFRQTGLAMTLVFGAALLVVQGVVARRLARRVDALSLHMTALREGRLEAVPPADAGSDEIGTLSHVVAEATERLRAARAAQDRLVAEAAHELRTPLHFMKTSIDLGLRHRNEPEEIAGALEDVRVEVDRLSSLATRLLDLATAERGRWARAPGDLAELAREAGEAIRAEAEQKGVIVDVVAPEAVPATFDPQGIRQAIDNLLANALAFGPAGGTVRLEVSRADGLARIAVHDEGPGIAAGDRERIFQPFERGKLRRAGGAGLGLAIVREVARGHGGRAYVGESERGARIVIELPARGE